MTTPAFRSTGSSSAATESGPTKRSRSASQFLANGKGHQVEVKSFSDRYFPFEAREIKVFLHSFSEQIDVDLVFTHRLEDRHQDHRLVAELTWNAFRNHLIFEYEIPKFEGDLGQPNIFVPLDKELSERKIQLTFDSFESQHNKSWFRPETFSSLLHLRGLECNSDSGCAEAFHCRKLILSN